MKDIIDILRALPFPLGSFVDILQSITSKQHINSNLNRQSIKQNLLAFIGIFSILSFLIPIITNINIFMIIDGWYVFIYLLIVVLPISIIYAFIVYLFTYRNSKTIKNISALIFQGVKFSPYLIMFISISMALAIENILIDDINIISNSDAFNESKEYNILVVLTIMFLILFFHFIIRPTYRFLMENKIKYKKLLLFVILISVPTINNILYTVPFYPKIDTYKLFNQKNFCQEIYEKRAVSQEISFETFELNCLNLFEKN